MIVCACSNCADYDSPQPGIPLPEGWAEHDGQTFCPECFDFAVTDAGEVICACEVPEIDWGPIQTGNPNYCIGRDDSGRRWIKEDRGGWSVPRPIEDDEEE